MVTSTAPQRSIGRSLSDTTFDVVNYFVLSLALLAVLYPLYFIIIASFSSPEAVNAGRVWLWPQEMTDEGYRRIIRDQNIWIGYRNSIIYTVLGTAVNMALTIPGAYALSRKDFLGRGVFTMFIAFTMFFQGGLIPRYLLVRSLGILDTTWAMILPNAVMVWNVVITRTFFQSTLPDELYEAAAMDGCSNSRFFVQIVLPLSTSVLAVMVLFYGVFHWNSFFDALMFLRSRNRMPLQIILRDILISAQVQAAMAADAETVAEQQRIAELVKYGVIIVASAPVLALYPFLQKYFVKGVMIGAIKG